MKPLQRNLVGLFLPFLFLFSLKSNAQLRAAFTVNSTTLSCPTKVAIFTDQSRGNPVRWFWDFGDNVFTNIQNPSHTYAKAGTYSVRLDVQDSAGKTDAFITTVTVSGPLVQYSRTMDTLCSAITVKFTPKGSGGTPLTYSWDFGDGKTSSSITPSITHPYRGGNTYFVNLTVRDNKACSVKVADTLSFGSVAAVLPASPNTMVANRECQDAFGWTNYYYDNNTADPKDDIILLSLNKNGNNIGTVGDRTFRVKVTATADAGLSKSILVNSPVISNPSGYYAMNRYWVVEPTAQPATPVGVKFYFNDQDVDDINGSYPTGDATFDQLIFYKAKNGNPDPTTNLSGATEVVSIFNGDHADETHWLYAYNGNGSHVAEFLVSSFSGGGAGVTVNRQTLPLKVVSFTGRPENDGVVLNWTVSSEINVERFEVESSADGGSFTAIGQVASKGSASTVNQYIFTDSKVGAEKARFYRLAVVDRDGRKSYSKIVRVGLPAATSAVSLYPVPANNYLTVSLKNPVNKSCTVEIFNSLGLKVMKLMETAPGNSFDVNTSSLPPGRYRMIIYSSNDKIGNANFIVVR